MLRVFSEATENAKNGKCKKTLKMTDQIAGLENARFYRTTKSR